MKIVTTGLLTILLTLTVHTTQTYGDEATPGLPDEKTLLKMRVKDLKEILLRKGADAECVACTSKREYVERIHETASWPDMTPTPTPEEAESKEPSTEDLQKMFADSRNSDYVRELRERLRASGVDASNAFAANGGIKPEELERILHDMKVRSPGSAGSAEGEAAKGDETIQVDDVKEDVKTDL